MKKILLFVSLSVYNVGKAQNWICDIKPGAKLFSTSLFHSDFSEKINNTEIQFDYSRKHQVSKLCLEPELFMDFYNLNNKWHFGFGISTYNWTSKSFLSGFKNDYTSRVDKNIDAKNFQFMLTGSRLINFKKRIGKSLSSNLITGLGFNSLYPKNEFTESVNFPNGDYPLNFFYSSITQLYGSNRSNHLSLAVLLKYELNFLSKKNNKSIFNLTFSYQQGFSNLNSIYLNAKNSNLDVSVITKSMGSGFRIGVSKTFQFQKINIGM